MKKSVKKIIAREFLFLLGSSVLFISMLIAWELLHQSNYYKQTELRNELEGITKIKALPYRLRVFYYLNKTIFEDEKSKLTDSEKFIDDIKREKDAFEIYDLLKQRLNLTNEFSVFMDSISSDTKSEDYLNNIHSIESELTGLEGSLFNYIYSEDDAYEIGFVFLIVIFGFRYLFYATRWSINQLRS